MVSLKACTTAFVVAAALGLPASSCSAPEGGSDARGGPPVGHAPNGDYLFPAQTLTDWVSYMDHLSAVTVVADQEIPAPDSVVRNREGYIGRRARIRIDDPIWTNTGVTPLEGEFETNVWGWYLKGDQRTPFSGAYSPRLEVGGRYVMALKRFERGLAALTPESVFPVTGDPIATEDVQNPRATARSPDVREQTSPGQPSFVELQATPGLHATH